MGHFSWISFFSNKWILKKSWIISTQLNSHQSPFLIFYHKTVKCDIWSYLFEDLINLKIFLICIYIFFSHLIDFKFYLIVAFLPLISSQTKRSKSKWSIDSSHWFKVGSALIASINFTALFLSLCFPLSFVQLLPECT